MAGRWFDSSRQIFWDNNQQDLTIPGSFKGTSGTFDTFYAPELYTATQVVGSSIGANLTAVPSITPGGNWISIAMSASGQYQSAIDQGVNIWLSSDYGITWGVSPGTPPPVDFYKIAISASGQYQSVVARLDYIYVSSDYGRTWTQVNQSVGIADYSSIDVSASGQYQTAVAYNNPIYISSDYGITWTPADSQRGWYDVAVSASGQYQTATDANTLGVVYTSSNYGVTWTSVSVNAGLTNRIVVMSATGQYQIVNADGVNSIYLSSDYGISWNPPVGALVWSQIAISASGQYMIAYDYINGYLWISTDYGSTWNTNSVLIGVTDMAVSAAADYFTIGVIGDTIYTSTTPVILPNVQIGIGTISSIVIPALGLSSITTDFISSGVITTGDFSTLTATISSIVTTAVSSITGQISSLITQNLSSVQLQTSSIRSNNISSLSGFISSLTTQNLSSVQVQTSSIRSNNISSLTGQISSLNTINLSSVQLQTSSIVSNNISSLTGFISSLITQNLSSVQFQTSSIVSNNISSASGQISSLTTQNLSSVQLQTSSIRSNNISSLTGFISSLITQNVSSVQLQTSSIVSNNISSASGQISSLTTQNLSSVQLQTSSIRSNNISSLTGVISSLTTQNLSSVQLQTSSIVSNNISSLSGFISSLITQNLSSVQLQTSSIVSNNISSLTGQISSLSVVNGSFSNLTTSNSFNSWQTTTTGDSFRTGTVSNFNVGSGNFTMECFFYPTATPASFGTIMTLATTATAGHEFRISQRNGFGGLGFLYPSGALADSVMGLTAASTLTLNTWCHLALTRSTNWMFLYSNGTAVLSTNLVSHSYNESKQLSIFRNPYVSDPFGQGYINSARVVLGQILYSGNFIPPTQQLTTNSVGAYGFNVLPSLPGAVAFLGGTVSTFTDAGPSALALTISGSPRSGTIVPTTFTGRIGINCNSPQFALDVNGTANISGNLFMGRGVNAPILANGYNTIGISGGNSWGYMYGAFQSLNDGIHLSYNYISCNLGPTNDTRGYIPNVAGGTSQLDLQYGQIQFQTGAVNTAPSTLMTLTTNGLGINCNSPSKMLDVNGTATISPPFNNILINASTQQILLANGSPLTAPYLFAQSVSTAPARIRIGGYSNSTSMPISFNENGGNIGIGLTNPGVQLDLSTDGARKLTTNTWTTGSDERIKKHISSANLELCYSTLKQIDLKYFEWDRSIPQLSTVQDRHSLGFIAQEIKPIFPNAVTFDSNMGLSDFHSLNIDQVYKMHYGATKKLMDLVEQQGSTIQGIQRELSTLRG